MRRERLRAITLPTGSVIHKDSHADPLIRCTACAHYKRPRVVGDCRGFCSNHRMPVGHTNWCVHFTQHRGNKP